MANGTNGTPHQQNVPQRQGNPAARNGARPSGNPPKKADVIIQITKDISRKQEDVRNQTQLINSQLESVTEISNQSKENAQQAINKSDAVYNVLVDSISALRQEMTYLAAQSENIYLNLTQKLAELNQAVENIKLGNGEAPVQYDAAQAVPQQQLDCDAIADKLAERLVLPEHGAEVAAIDYDVLSNKIAEKMPAPVKGNSSDESAAIIYKPVEFDYDVLSDKLAKKISVPVQAYTAAAPVTVQPAAIDYDELSAKVAEHVPVQEAISPDYIASKVAEQIVIPAPVADIDYDLLARKVAQYVGTAPAAAPTPVVVTSGNEVNIDYEYLADKVANKILAEKPAEVAPVEIDYDVLADKVAERIPAPAPAPAPVQAAAVEQPAVAAPVEIDYDVLADKVAEKLSVEKPAEPTVVEVDYEYLSDKVAEKLLAGKTVEPVNAEIDIDALADKVVDRLITDKPAEPVAAEINYDVLADKVAERIPAPAPVQAVAVEQPSPQINIDEEGLADKIALKVGSLKADDFDIVVDEEGCIAISKAISENLDYDAIATVISEKLTVALDIASNAPDYEEIANLVSEKVNLPTINEDAIADKAAAALSNYLPDIDTDDIADKVANQVISTLPAENKSEEAVQVELDYDALADKVATKVVNSLPESSDARFDSIDKDLEEIKAALENGVQVVQPAHVGESSAVEDSEELVTVSDIVTTEEPPATGKEGVPDPKTVPSGDDESLEIGDELSETSGGVDFLNMMRYNRSFIARIIQGTDDQKEYYGKIKTALLSYKKVNSNIAWGAERFHKGRETIARLKIRGKTLILYLNLDPAEFPYSVYHHKDVSDNKSLHGTPLAVKVMSPLGVKKAIRLIDAMLEKREGIKRPIPERNYAEMYPYETIEELIDDGLVQDVRKP